MLRIPLPRNPADHRETPGLGQTVGGRPIIHLLGWQELLALRNLTVWAAEGCIHENRTALAAQLRRDADWLNAVMDQRIRQMRGGARG